MNRRDALQLLATGAVLQLPPARMWSTLRQARSVLALQAAAAPRTLNPHQYATVKTMAELILPRTETPGATDVGVSDFIDLMLTEWYDERQTKDFLAGLADIDARSQKLFRASFVDCAPDQQAANLNALGEQMLEDELGHNRAFSPSESPSERNIDFYSTLRWLTLTGYYTSEAGATEELHFEIIPDHYDGCATTAIEQEAPKRP